MVRALLLGLGLVACGGPVEETLVDELRVVAAIPDHPEVAPGEPFGVDVLTVDPADEGYRSLAWVCTPTGPPGEPCLEETLGSTLGWVSPVDATGRAEGLQVAPILAGALAGQEIEELEVPIWILTCADDLCPIIEDAPGTYRVDVAWDRVVPGLADPAALVRDLPIEGVALTRRSVLVSLRPADARNQHPRIVEPPSDPLSAPSDASAELMLNVQDTQDVTAYGYTTLGGFAAAAVEAEDGRLDLEWFPGVDAEPGATADLVVVVSDGRGGEALWRGRGRVTEPIGVD